MLFAMFCAMHNASYYCVVGLLERDARGAQALACNSNLSYFTAFMCSTLLLLNLDIVMYRLAHWVE